MRTSRELTGQDLAKRQVALLIAEIDDTGYRQQEKIGLIEKNLTKDFLQSLQIVEIEDDFMSSVFIPNAYYEMCFDLLDEIAPEN
jgi:hypothetical protein